MLHPNIANRHLLILFGLIFVNLAIMKLFRLYLLFTVALLNAQDIRSIQLFNPQTNDETPVIGVNEQLILRFDDLSNSSQRYRYTIKHYDRNWQDDNLFFNEYATGNLNGVIENMKYSFNTVQAYTHYELPFPNQQMEPKISGNFELIVYKDSQDRPLFKKRFCIVEDGAALSLNVSRYAESKNPALNQRIEVRAVGNGSQLSANPNSVSLNIIQNNNWDMGIYNQRPSSNVGNQLLFQQMSLAFPGNNEFYYFDNKNTNNAFDMVAAVDHSDGTNKTYLYPVWAYPLNYQYQPDVNGAYYFRRNDLGIERDASTEADYSWVYFALDSEKSDKELYVLGQFNDYTLSQESQMLYDEDAKQYVAKIYLKQGFYNYILATKDKSGSVDYGEINGNFWQTQNLYQSFLYYRDFNKNYDGLLGYGEYRRMVQ